jgi:hypothetical protein
MMEVVAGVEIGVRVHPSIIFWVKGMTLEAPLIR